MFVNHLSQLSANEDKNSLLELSQSMTQEESESFSIPMIVSELNIEQRFASLRRGIASNDGDIDQGSLVSNVTMKPNSDDVSVFDSLTIAIIALDWSLTFSHGTSRFRSKDKTKRSRHRSDLQGLVLSRC